jgi:hypothetical protein
VPEGLCHLWKQTVTKTHIIVSSIITKVVTEGWLKSNTGNKWDTKHDIQLSQKKAREKKQEQRTNR